MLAQNELSKLYSLISDGNQTFENISKIFKNQFTIDSQKKAIMTIIIILKDNVLNLTQKIISYFILYDTSSISKFEANPYLFIILDKLKTTSENVEQNFLLDFLYKKINYLNKTVNEFLKEKPKEMKINITQIQIQWDKYYKGLLKQNNINIEVKDKMRPIIYNRNNMDIKNINNPLKLNALSNVNNEFNLNYFNTGYMSYRPVNNNFVSSEPFCLLPNLKHKFLWENK